MKSTKLPHIFSGLLVLLVLMALGLVACGGAVDTETAVGGLLEGENDIPVDPSEIVDSILKTPPSDRLEAPIEVVIPDFAKLGGVPAIIDATEVVLMDDSPSGYGLRITGTIPTPCDELKINISEPDEYNRISVEVYATSKPGVVCIQIIEEFDEAVPLEDFDPEIHQIWVNGEEVSEFQYHKTG